MVKWTGGILERTIVQQNSWKLQPFNERRAYKNWNVNKTSGPEVRKSIHKLINHPFCLRPCWFTARCSEYLGGGFIFFIFTPIWGRFPFWLIFFNWVETTNQIWSISFHGIIPAQNHEVFHLWSWVNWVYLHWNRVGRDGFFSSTTSTPTFFWCAGRTYPEKI